MRLWVEPAGGERKSADVEEKTVTLIYPYPAFSYYKNDKFWVLVSLNVMKLA